MNRREFVIGTAGLLAVRRTLQASKPPSRIMTGLPTLDEATGGFGPGEVVQVAGNACSGCSDLALQIASHVSAAAPVGYFAPFVPWIGDVQMNTKKRCYNRIVYPIADVPLTRFECARLTESDRERIRRAEVIVSERPLVIYGTLEEANWDLQTVCKNARRISRDNGLRLLVIDNLMELQPRQLWTDKRTKAELNAMGVFFKGLAEELQITVLVCSGLDLWTNQRDDCRPQAIDIAGFGLPEEYCSTVALTYRPSYVRPDLEESYRKGEITLTKTRSGRRGTLAMGWDRKNAQFADGGFRMR